MAGAARKHVGILSTAVRLADPGICGACGSWGWLQTVRWADARLWQDDIGVFRFKIFPKKYHIKYLNTCIEY